MDPEEIVQPGAVQRPKIRVRIPKVGEVRFPEGMDPAEVDRQARILYMKAGAGQLPINKTPEPQMGPPLPPERPSPLRQGIQDILTYGPITGGMRALTQTPEIRKRVGEAIGQAPEMAWNAGQWLVPSGVAGPMEKALEGYRALAPAIQGLQQEGKFFAGAEKPRQWGSKLLDVLREKMPPTATAEQVRAIASPKYGVKPAELEATQFENVLAGKQKIGKAELVSEVERSLPQLEDVVLKSELVPIRLTEQEFLDGPAWHLDPQEARRLYREGGPRFERMQREYLSETGADIYDTTGKQTKYQEWQEPGGSDYFELFVTAPRSRHTADFNSPQYKNWLFKERLVDSNRARDAFMNTEAGKPTWRDQHDYPDIENPVVRLRANTRTSVDGKRYLFLEEMQPPSKEILEKAPPWVGKFWSDIGMKRALKYAADNGYDGVAWTTGEMQAKRYDLSKQVDNIGYRKTQAGWDITGDKDGTTVIGKMSVPDNQLEGTVGKELAEKIRAGGGSRPEGGPLSKGTWKTFSGVDLKVGGEGLKRIYDEMLPRKANEIGKKLGMRVGTTKFDIAGHKGQGRLQFEVMDPQGELYDAFPTNELAQQAARDAGPGYYVAGQRDVPAVVQSIDLTPTAKTELLKPQNWLSIGPIGLTAIMANYIRNNSTAKEEKTNGRSPTR